MPESKAGKYIGIGVTIFAVVFLSLVVMLLLISNLGVGAAIVASVMAFLPALFYLIPLIWLDRYDPEPLWLLGLAFAWGALVSLIISYFINTQIGQVTAMSYGPEAGMACMTLFSAPIFEEGSKGLGVILLLIFFRKYFDDILDGIVFAGTIALGFATVENVLYYGGILLVGNARLLLLIFIMRGILSPFAHVTFTSMTGIGCGISRESHNWFVRILLPVLGYVCAVTLHFIWNFMSTVLKVTDLFEGSWYYGYMFIEVPFFLLFVGFAAYVMHRQNRILKEMLAIDVARQLIPEEHLKKATSAFGSTFWLLEGVFTGKFSARNKYLRAVGKLGLSYWHIQRATAAHGQTGSFQQNPILREEVLNLLKAHMHLLAEILDGQRDERHRHKEQCSCAASKRAWIAPPSLIVAAGSSTIGNSASSVSFVSMRSMNTRANAPPKIVFVRYMMAGPAAMRTALRSFVMRAIRSPVRCS